METLGLVAGSGNLPFVAAREARAQGLRVVGIGLRGETSPDLEREVDRLHWIYPGELGHLIRLLRQERVSDLLLVGKIAITRLFADLTQVRPDLRALLFYLRLPDRRGDSILEALVDEFTREGITLHDCRRFLSSLLVRAGVLTSRAPTPEEKSDIELGRRIARAVADLKIGQTVVVRAGTVVAVESVEGTDAAIRRGGELARGGIVVVKVCRTDQDMRFDLPVVGRQTVAALEAAGATALALEAEKTLLLDREEVLQAADRLGITLVAV